MFTTFHIPQTFTQIKIEPRKTTRMLEKYEKNEREDKK